MCFHALSVIPLKVNPAIHSSVGTEKLLEHQVTHQSHKASTWQNV